MQSGREEAAFHIHAGFQPADSFHSGARVHKKNLQHCSLQVLPTVRHPAGFPRTPAPGRLLHLSDIFSYWPVFRICFRRKLPCLPESRFPDLRFSILLCALSSLLTFRQWLSSISLPAYSDRIVQDSHLIPSSARNGQHSLTFFHYKRSYHNPGGSSNFPAFLFHPAPLPIFLFIVYNTLRNNRGPARTPRCRPDTRADTALLTNRQNQYGAIP